MSKEISTNFHIHLKLFNHLSNLRKKQLSLLLFTMVASGIAEVFSLAAIVPFLAIITEPSSIWNIEWLRSSLLTLGILTPQELIVPITIIFCFLTLFSVLIRILCLWLNAKMAAAIGSDLSIGIYKKALYQPYLEYVTSNSSVILSALTTKMTYAVASTFQSLSFIYSVISSIFLLVTICLVNLKVAFSIGFIFGSAYMLIGYLVKDRISSNSSIVAVNDKKIFKLIQEGYGGLREITLSGTQEIFLRLFAKIDHEVRVKRTENKVLGGIPKFFLEGLSLILLAIITAASSIVSPEDQSLIPVIGAIALAAQKLLPNLQMVYTSWLGMKAYSASLNQLIDILSKDINYQFTSFSKPVLAIENKLNVDKLFFRYSKESPYILKDVNLSIKKGERVGIVGKTGSGKSTLIDLIMGLLSPTDGKILVDGADINAFNKNYSLGSWWKSISHVPQSIYLADLTIAENIAFGLAPESINMELVKKVAERAQISEFIENSNNGYFSMIGERGIRLSGGQRQRIGIARALYKDATVLILDEATSALDNLTESDVMQSINALRKDLTVLIVAHRLSTLSKCDRVIYLSDGRIIKDGTPEDIIKLMS